MPRPINKDISQRIQACKARGLTRGQTNIETGIPLRTVQDRWNDALPTTRTYDAPTTGQPATTRTYDAPTTGQPATTRTYDAPTIPQHIGPDWEEYTRQASLVPSHIHIQYPRDTPAAVKVGVWAAREGLPVTPDPCAGLSTEQRIARLQECKAKGMTQEATAEELGFALTTVQGAWNCPVRPS